MSRQTELLNNLARLASRLWSRRNPAKRGELFPQNFLHKVEYEKRSPSKQNAVDLFRGRWSSIIPGQENTGFAQLFFDPRIDWLLSKVGSLSGKSVLELGPLEGGHTKMLEDAGAHVFAIEGNTDAFLRCLVVKNTFNLSAEFSLGDFSRSFGTDSKFDLVVASGVLYHMSDPLSLLKRISNSTDSLFLWTHYFEENVNLWHPSLQKEIGVKWRPDEAEVHHFEGSLFRVVPQFYLDALGWDGFCGGPEIHSKWLIKEDLLKYLELVGFNNIKIAFDDPAHQNGPSFCILATRSNG